MVVKRSICNNNGTHIFTPVGSCARSEAFSNGFAHGVGKVAAGGCQGESLRTYQRRKHMKQSLQGKLPGNGRVSADTASQLTDKTINGPFAVVDNYEQASLPLADGHVIVNGSGDCQDKHWPKVVLQNMYQSLSGSEGGIEGCIRDALAFHAQNDHTNTAQESAHCNKKRHNYSLRTGLTRGKFQNMREGHPDRMSTGNMNDPNLHTVTELCQRAFFNIIISENFALICKLLLENFEGNIVRNFFDYNLINTRMKEGAYEQSPMLFSSDIQKAWRKLQKFGAQLVSLAKKLLNMSRTSYYEQMGGTHSSIRGGEHELHTVGSDCDAKPEQPEASGSLQSTCICRCCREKADGQDCLVCDSCEEMYHVSCIQPVVKEIPSRSWYCANCSAGGVESPHENCVVCERLNSTLFPITAVPDDTIIAIEETAVEKEESSERVAGDGDRSRLCKVCRREIRNGERTRICSHPFCVGKYYHLRCLEKEQLRSYGPCWYCPSCLCRDCLLDKDDDKIVLCDGCDHAHHIYCMDPPRTSVPRGKWFCKKCDTDIQEIHKAKRACEARQDRKREEGDKMGRCDYLGKKRRKNSEEHIDKVKGVDMLLSAASALSFEEKFARRSDREIGRTRHSQRMEAIILPSFEL